MQSWHIISGKKFITDNKKFYERFMQYFYKSNAFHNQLTMKFFNTTDYSDLTFNKLKLASGTSFSNIT